MAHFIYPQATSTTAFLLDSVIVSPTVDSAVPANNKGMPVVNLAGEGLGPLDVASGASSALTLRVVLSDDSTISIEEDKDYGTVGANTIRTAAQIGNATGAADFGSGADSAQTLRVTPSTRSETATTPLAVRLSDGTAFYAGATEATVASIDTEVTAINTKTPSLGQALMAASVPVAIASDQSTLPISAASLPLPSGAATESSLVAMSGKLPATLGQKVSAQSMSVTIASDQSDIDVAQAGTWDIQNITGTVSLPTGASTEATLATLSGKVANDYGAAAGAVRTAAQIGNAGGVADFDEGASSSQTLRVVLADESKPQLGLAPVAVITRAYSSINVTGTYSSLGAPLSATANMVAFFETGGVPLIVGWGSVDKFIIPPGGAESPLPVTIPAATQLQIKTADGSTVSSGNLYMTVLG
jgi:tellurite resistance protein